ncbi:MAG: cation:proton antiporter, partial [Bacilli bacterium]|nr:cation:proton antiporter [Erysipelotrichaceae bacterium]MDY2746410.1 cation:proton antiporter [Bacilli bacterium]MDY3889920.1 cation:proton antiporter [Bacilli bacterium]
MEYYDVLLPLALILVMSKLFCIGCRKIGAPQVVGMLLTGLLIGLAKYTPLNDLLLSSSSLEGIGFIAKIGVILIMFSAGLETDLKKIKSTGLASIVITILGVILPLGLGFLVSSLFFGLNGKQQILQNLFYGTILTATSVSVTIATLKELGKLDTNVGTAIVSAAILDDIIGVIVLSFVIGLSGSTQSSHNPLANG